MCRYYSIYLSLNHYCVYGLVWVCIKQKYTKCVCFKHSCEVTLTYYTKMVDIVNITLAKHQHISMLMLACSSKYRCVYVQLYRAITIYITPTSFLNGRLQVVFKCITCRTISALFLGCTVKKTEQRSSKGSQVQN